MSEDQASEQFDQLDRALLERRPGVKWQRYGPGVLPLWVADMDFPIAPMVTDAIAAHLATDDLGYPMPELGKEVAAEFAARMDGKHSWSIDPDDVRLTQDVIQAMQAVLFTCTEPGDGVTMVTPIYHPFLMTIEEMNRPLVDNPWNRTADSWELDLEGLRSTLAEGGCRAMILCNPHNPSGRVFTRDELIGLGELAVEYDLIVIADEIHSDLIHPGGNHIAFASLRTDIADQTITLNSASKAFNLASVKLAVAHTTSGRIIDRLDSLPGHMLGGINAIGMRVTLEVWRRGKPWLDAVVRRLTANRDLLADLLAEQISEIVFTKPEATYLAWLDCRSLELGGEAPSRHFLKTAKVALNPGEAFGSNGVGHARLNFATSPEIITEAVERMAASL